MSALDSAFTPPGLWISVWKLLRLRLVIFVNNFRRSKLRSKIGLVVAVLGFLVLLGFILFLSITLLSFLRSAQFQSLVGDAAPLLDAIPTLLISASGLGILLTSFGVLLQALYLSGDMDFLMSAPVPIRAVFIAKLVQAILPNFAIMALFSLPILIGLGVSGGYNVLYYPLVVVELVLISLAGASLASLLVMAAARIFPARRIAEVLGFVVGTFFFAFSQSSRFAHYDYSDQQIASFLRAASRFNQPWSPFAWAGNGLVALGKGEWLPAVGLLVLSLVLSAAVFTVALVTAERLYYTGWSSLQNNRRKKKAARTLPSTAEGSPAALSRPARLARLVPTPLRAILVKDLLLYRRDLRNLSQLITPLILSVVYAIGLLRTPQEAFGGQGDAPQWVMSALSNVLLYADVGLALFLGWMLVNNLAGSGFSMEGKNYWLLKAAPLNTRTLIAGKFLVAYLPSLALCLVYVIILKIIKGSGLLAILNSAVAIAFTQAGLVGIYLAFGIARARFDWDNPAQKNRAGCTGMLAGFGYLVICLCLFILPPLGAGLLRLPPILGQAVGLLLGSAAGIAGAVIPLAMVEQRVATLAE
jgi:ABC-2 type transport system permease protein